MITAVPNFQGCWKIPVHAHNKLREVDVGILSVSTRVELPKSRVVSALFT